MRARAASSSCSRRDSSRASTVALTFCCPEDSSTRTVRVELAAGDRKVSAAIDARDESRLLQLLDAARTRAA